MTDRIDLDELAETDRSDRGSWWAWGLLVAVAVFLLAEVGLLLVAG